jgi:hypothetical protein
VKDHSTVAGTAVVVTCVPQGYDPPEGVSVIEPEPVTLVPSVQTAPCKKVTVSVVLLVKVKLPELLLVLAYPLPAQLEKVYPDVGVAVRLTVLPHA